MEEFLTRWAMPTGIVVFSLLLGAIVNRTVVAWARGAAQRRQWSEGEAVAKALTGMPEVLFVVAGATVAAYRMNLAEDTLETVKRFLLVAAILAVTLLITRLAASFMRLYTARNEAAAPTSTIMVNITRIAVFTIGSLIALSALGIAITPLLTALGVGGLAVALAMQETLSNLFAGLQIIGSKQIKHGDYILLETGQEGYVEDMTWRFTTIRQLENNMIVIPNSKLASSLMINFYEPIVEMSFLVDLRVAFGSDLERVEEVTLRIAREVLGRVEGAVADFEPTVRFHTFGDSSILFSVILGVHEYTRQYRLRHEFIKAIHAAYAEEGIEIPFPQRVVHKPEAQ